MHSSELTLFKKWNNLNMEYLRKCYRRKQVEHWLLMKCNIRKKNSFAIYIAIRIIMKTHKKFKQWKLILPNMSKKPSKYREISYDINQI